MRREPEPPWTAALGQAGRAGRGSASLRVEARPQQALTPSAAPNPGGDCFWPSAGGRAVSRSGNAVVRASRLESVRARWLLSRERRATSCHPWSVCLVMEKQQPAGFPYRRSADAGEQGGRLASRASRLPIPQRGGLKMASKRAKGGSTPQPSCHAATYPAILYRAACVALTASPSGLVGPPSSFRTMLLRQ